MIPSPGPDQVPCSTGCAHCDCVSARRVAESPCVVCGNPIGYDRFFRRYTAGWNGPVAHATCSATPRHDIRCLDDDGVLDLCVCGLNIPGEPADTYCPDDRELPNPYWTEDR